MAAAPAVAVNTWAATVDGWPVYAARDTTTGLQERLQENIAGEVVDAAGVVYATNAQGIPLDAAGVAIPQATQAIQIRDLAMGYMQLMPHLPPVVNCSSCCCCSTTWSACRCRICFESRPSCYGYGH